MREVTRDYAQVNGEQTTACVAEVNDVLVTIESTDTGEKVEEVISTRIWRLRGLRMTADNYGDFERGSPSKLGALGTLTLISERSGACHVGISRHFVPQSVEHCHGREFRGSCTGRRQSALPSN